MLRISGTSGAVLWLTFGWAVACSSSQQLGTKDDAVVAGGGAKATTSIGGKNGQSGGASQAAGAAGASEQPQGGMDTEAGAGGESGQSQGGTSGQPQGGTGNEAGAGGASGQPQGGTGNEAGAGGTSGQPQGGTAGGGSTPCEGTLDEVSRAWGVECPASDCEARAWATCEKLPAEVKSSRSKHCTFSRSDLIRANEITLDLGNGRGKSCYYESNHLVHAAAWGVGPLYCNATSAQITAGAPIVCGSGGTIFNLPATTLCDRTSFNGAAGASQGGAGGAGSGNSAGAPSSPEAKCLNRFADVCQPCCAAQAPDCTDKPDGYPGYDCTPLATTDNIYYDYCTCSCSGGNWRCAC